MPKLFKILSRSKKKQDDSTSVASVASNTSKRSKSSFRSSRSKQNQANEDSCTGLQVCGYLVEKEGANLPKLHKHAWKGDLNKVKADLKKGGDAAKHGVDNKGRNALHLAATMGHSEVLLHLVSEGLKIEGRDAQLRTPLLKAADAGRADCVQRLLANGADPNSREASGLTALHVAVHRRELGMVRELLAAGAQLDAHSNVSQLHGTGD